MLHKLWTRIAPVVGYAAVTGLCVGGTPIVARAQIDPATTLPAQAGWRALATDQVAAADRKAWTRLAHVNYQEGNLREAIAALDRAVAKDPVATEARATLERWRREAALQDDMHRLVGARFTVWFEQVSDEGFASRVLEALDSAYWRIGAEIGVYPLRIVPVVIYSAPVFREVTQLPAWSLGAYDGTIRVPMREELQDRTELESLLAHELTHAFVRTLAPRGVPAWLSEGLATALASSDLRWAESVVSTEPGPLPIESLASGFQRLDADHAQRAYATSALVARQLLATAGGVGVTNLLRDLGEGAELDAALRRRANCSLAELESGAHARN